VYRPAGEIEPAEADQVTEVFAVPETVAVNCCVAPVVSDVDVGETTTTTGVGAAETITEADADFVGSAALFAVTWNVPVVLGV
jgi:hypothetical protein